jgi:hypothetical protein
MKRIVLSLFALVLMDIVPGFPSQVGAQTEVQAATEQIITWDVAINCRTWRINQGFRLKMPGVATASSPTARYFPPALFALAPRPTIQPIAAVSAAGCNAEPWRPL